MTAESIPTLRALEEQIGTGIQSAVRAAFPGEADPDTPVTLEQPRNEKFGDLTTPIALRLAKRVGKPPREVAESIAERLRRDTSATLKSHVAEIQIEGPGFINIQLSRLALTAVLNEILDRGADFGSSSDGNGRRVLLEFVSANPTGPLTVAHGRQAAVGDSLARILSFTGHKVETEYYNNDEGIQIQLLGKSVLARIREAQGEEVSFPDKGYQGSYIVDLARDFISKKNAGGAKKDADAGRVADYAMGVILDQIRDDLKAFEAHFDQFYSQKVLGASGKVEETLALLEKRKKVYAKEGAVWFRSTDFNDDKDRVMVKSDKTYTYLTPDVAYHRDKFERGYDLLINIWGPDHHGYVSRLLASQEALGYDPGRIRILISQLVTLFEGKKKLRMSTRAGEFITLREILKAVGKDAARFFFVMRKCDSHLDFDLELAKSQTQDNPVYYVQYAHARISSIRKLQEEKGIKLRAQALQPDKLREVEEIRVLRHLRQFPRTVAATAQALEPSILVDYLKNLAALFHQFYTQRRVVTEDLALTQARLSLACAVQTVIANGLRLLGVSSPEKM